MTQNEYDALKAVISGGKQAHYNGRTANTIEQLDAIRAIEQDGPTPTGADHVFIPTGHQRTEKRIQILEARLEALPDDIAQKVAAIALETYVNPILATAKSANDSLKDALIERTMERDQALRERKDADEAHATQIAVLNDCLEKVTAERDAERASVNRIITGDSVDSVREGDDAEPGDTPPAEDSAPAAPAKPAARTR